MTLLIALLTFTCVYLLFSLAALEEKVKNLSSKVRELEKDTDVLFKIGN